MKHIRVFEDFKPDPDYTKGGKNYASINDISDAFSTFYNQLNDLAKKRAFSDMVVRDHIEAAVEELDKAWEELCNEHGVDYEKTEVNL